MFEIIDDIDVLDNIKPTKKSKKKLFIGLCVGVAIIALVGGLTRKKNGNGVTYLDGYPSGAMGGGSGGSGGSAELSPTDVYTGELESIQDEYNKQLDNMQGYYEEQITSYDSVLSQYDTELNNSNSMLLAMQEQNNLLTSQVNYKDTVAQMQNNSALWWLTSDANEKTRLAQENERLGFSIGAVKDAGSGTWSDANGSPLFINSGVSAAQNLASTNKTSSVGTDYQAVINSLIAGGAKKDSSQVVNAVIQRADKMSSSGIAVSYDKNVDYQAAINSAKSQGASSATISYLEAQRNAKIAGENLNTDGSKKSSSSSYSSSSTKSSSSSSSTKSTTSSSSSSTKSTSSTPTVVKAGSDGKAPKGLSVGTTVQTNGGNYKITGVRSDGSYISKKV